MSAVVIPSIVKGLKHHVFIACHRQDKGQLFRASLELLQARDNVLNLCRFALQSQPAGHSDGFYCPVIVGKTHGQIIELYECDGDFVLDVMDEEQTMGTHWHPNDVEDAVNDIVEFMVMTSKPLLFRAQHLRISMKGLIRFVSQGPATMITVHGYAFVFV